MYVCIVHVLHCKYILSLCLFHIIVVISLLVVVLVVISLLIIIIIVRLYNNIY